MSKLFLKTPNFCSIILQQYLQIHKMEVVISSGILKLLHMYLFPY